MMTLTKINNRVELKDGDKVRESFSDMVYGLALNENSAQFFDISTLMDARNFEAFDDAYSMLDYIFRRGIKITMGGKTKAILPQTARISNPNDDKLSFSGIISLEPSRVVSVAGASFSGTAGELLEAIDNGFVDDIIEIDYL